MESTYEGKPIKVEQVGIGEDETLRIALVDKRGLIRWLHLRGKDLWLVEQVVKGTT